MGQWFSATDYDDNYNKKNLDYYNNKRFFKISRQWYPQYSQGVLWGRIEHMEYYRKLGWERDKEGEWIELEKEF